MSNDGIARIRERWFKGGPPEKVGVTQRYVEFGEARRWLIDRLDLRTGNILDLGSGHGFLTFEVVSRTRCHVVGLDFLAGEQMKMAKGGGRLGGFADSISWVVADARTIPFPDNTFDVVVSFNYDTLVERLAKRFGLALRHCRGAPRDFVKFLKPHGSVSWPLHPVPSAVFDGEPLLHSLSEDMNNDPLLLGAVPIKSELLREVQIQCGTFDVFQAIMYQWRGIVEAVRDADELVVVGYSFPKEDLYGRFLFQQGVRRRTHPFETIEYYNRTAKDGASILEVFGQKDAKVVWRGPVKRPLAHGT